MKLFYIIPLALAANAVHGQQWNLRHLGSDEYSRIYTDAVNAPQTACIEVKKGRAKNDQKLILADCSGRAKDKQEWRIDSDGFFHSKLDDNMCWQAGRDGPPLDGEYIRLFECDATNNLQKFVIESGGIINPVNDQSLCAVFRGVRSNLDIDPIILRNCDEVTNRAGWSGEGI